MNELPAIEREIALMVVTDLWNPRRRVAKIASHFSLKPNAVERLLAREDFQREVDRQQVGSDAFFTIADRHTRVADLQELYFRIPQRRTALKIKILSRIRQEVGDSRL